MENYIILSVAPNSPVACPQRWEHIEQVTMCRAPGAPTEAVSIGQALERQDNGAGFTLATDAPQAMWPSARFVPCPCMHGYLLKTEPALS